MNPNAGEWKPSASAAAWTPSGASAPAPAAIPTIAAPPAPAPTPPPPPPQAEDPDIDENDGLWKVVLNEVANGDREKAKRLIKDPDGLAQYPAVLKFLESAPAMEEVTEDVQGMKIDDNGKGGDDMEEDDEERDPVVQAVLKEGDPREHLNLVFIGHVDAGKSTLSGNILYLTDNVDKRTIEKYEREAKDLNRESWFLAFIMDTDEGERAKGKTVEVGKAFFDTPIKRYTILDAPGHKNYVPNMIQGASQADVGIMVISARKGEFEAGFDRGGQSREHALLARTLGVSYLVIVINKMDEPTVQWSKQRYEEIVKKMKPFLNKKCGFTIKREVKFIPISGLGGANVKEEVDPAVCPWWKEMYTAGEHNTSSPTLLSLLDSLEITGRNADAPLRIPILDRYSDRGTIAMGKVESGVVKPGMKVTVMPTRNVYKVEEVWAGEDPVAGARPGENVLVKLNNAKVEDIRRGFVICSDPPCRAVDKIICQIFVSDLPENTKLMTAGFECMFHAHTCEEEARVIKIFETTDSKGKVTKGARFVTNEMGAIVMLQLGQTVPLETFDHMSFLGRFTLRTEGKTVAIGKVTKVPPKKD